MNERSAVAPLGRTSKTDGLGYRTQYSYKADHSFNSASDTYGNVTREQDALNQPIDTSYGPYDQVASVKDQRGNTITTSFHASTDASCKLTGKPDTVRLARLTVAGVVTTNVALSAYCWNSDGSLKSQTDYLSATDLSKTRVTSYAYDTSAHLNVASITRTGWDGAVVTQTTTYDPLGRPKTETLQRRNTPTDATLISLSH